MKQILFILFFSLILALGATAQKTTGSKMTVFPNPTSDFIMVKDADEQLGFVAIYNLMGRNVREFEFSRDERFYIADLPKGYYLVHFQDKNHKTLFTNKLEKR
jgi:Secretion system C-terminal sorting domain